MTFLITLMIHLGLIAPLSHWLDRTMLPRFADESLEIDINEIHSNTPVIKASKKKLSPEKKAPPKPVVEKQKTETTIPEKVPEVPKPVEPPPLVKVEPPPFIKKEALRPVPKEKKPLSPLVEKDPESDVAGKQPPPVIKQLETPPAASQPRKPVETPPAASQPRKPVESPAEDRKERDTFDIASLQADRESSTGVAKQQKPILEEPSEQETVRSPLFIKKKKPEVSKEEEGDGLPDQIRGTFRNGQPEETVADNLQYSMNSYRWTFERFIENWVVDIQKWWKAPLDYITGKMPDGGDLWVQVHLDLSGKLLSYKVIQSNVTPEMELRAIQALIGSLKRPELPRTFSEDSLIINWRFIYPSLRPPLKMRR
ncbi:hypothetical protein KKI24_03980 [bacterium]|nr:hypothetical protein [bacterium]